MDVIKIGPKASVPRIALTRPTVEIETLMRGVNWRTREILDLEPAREAFKEILIRMNPQELSRPKLEDLAGAIFGRGLNADVLESAVKRVSDVMIRIGFSDQIDLSAEAAILPALVDRWDEIEAALDCPDQVKRFPVISLTDNVPHTTCRHRDDYALIKISYEGIKKGDIRLIGDEILSALKRANEIIFIRMDDKRMKGELAQMYEREGLNISEINKFFEKDGVPIRYSSKVSSVRAAFIHQTMNVGRISKSLEEKGFKLPILGIIVDYCAEDHPSFIKYDPQKGLVLVVISERVAVSEELNEGIFHNIIPAAKIELWEKATVKEIVKKAGEMHGLVGKEIKYDRLMGVEDQLGRRDPRNFGLPDVVKAVTALHAKPKLKEHSPEHAHKTPSDKDS